MIGDQDVLDDLVKVGQLEARISDAPFQRANSLDRHQLPLSGPDPLMSRGVIVVNSETDQ